MKYTDNEAKLVLENFFREMNCWGLEAMKLFKPDSKEADKVRDNLKDKLIQIYKKYVTPRERKTGRVEVMTISLGHPDYDPSTESIEKIHQTALGFEIKTKKNYSDEDYFETYRYKLKSTKNALLIDSRDRYSDFESKWVKDIL